MNESIILAIWPYILGGLGVLVGLQFKLVLWHYNQITAKISAINQTTQEMQVHIDTVTRRVTERLAIIETTVSYDYGTLPERRRKVPVHWSEQSDVIGISGGRLK